MTIRAAFTKGRCALVLAALFTLSLQACGGGGGDDEPTAAAVPNASFAGNYQYQLNKTQDSCKSSLSKTVSFVEGTGQSGNTVTVEGTSGPVDADNAGFTIISKTNKDGAAVTQTWVFRKTAVAGQLSVNINTTAKRSKASCSIVYGGTATRV
jgi:hypothetical protein